MSSRILWRFWLPPILWTALIFTASSASFSSVHTADWLATLINAIAGHPIAPDRFAAVHSAIRKAGHLTEYGILSALLLRAFRGQWRTAAPAVWTAEGRCPPRWRWAVAAIVIAAVVASLDEWHQLFVPGRNGSPMDVLVDTIGAALAQVLFFRT